MCRYAEAPGRHKHLNYWIKKNKIDLQITKIWHPGGGGVSSCGHTQIKARAEVSSPQTIFPLEDECVSDRRGYI